MSPYRFCMTITSNWFGFITSCMQVLSMILSSLSISGYSFAISLKMDKNMPSDIFKMFALWTQVTFLRPFFFAYSNASRMMRSLAFV